MSVKNLGIEKEFLRGLLDQASEGRARLPEFQRGWVWPMENIRSLLASISLGYPVGTLMMLRTGGDVRFKERPVEGTKPTKASERLILDGQQRLTSLYQALRLGEPIRTQDSRRRRLEGWFYIDIRKALDPAYEREEAFVFIPKERIVTDFRGNRVLDVSSRMDEFKGCLFPARLVFDHDDWLDEFDEHWDHDREMRSIRRDFRKQILTPFQEYQIPVIELGSDTPKQAVCQVFEKVNTGGVTLTVFELLTATFAADDFDLRRDWEDRRNSWSGPEYKVLREVSNTDFLQTVTLLATQEARAQYLRMNSDDERAPRIGCRRSDMLNLPLEAYRKWAAKAVEGYKSAAKLLHSLHIFDARFLPYGSQLIPLSALFASLGTDATSQRARDCISRWLWCGILGELYGGTTETRFARDVADVAEWIRGSDSEPRTIQEAQFAAGRLETLRTRGSAAYKGIYALLMKEHAVDWRSGEPMNVTTYFDDLVDIHHVFPKIWCERRGIKPGVYNTIINKTPLTARTNRVIGGYAPSEYIKRITNSAAVDRSVIETNILTHLIDPETLASDDFPAFMSARRERLIKIIETAMGKPVVALDRTEDVIEPEASDDELDDA